MQDQGRYLSAQEAAQQLGISVATLYAYVSRGLIRSEAVGGTKRTRRYASEDVAKLKARKDPQDASQAAQEALHWGTPVLESAISLMTDNQLYYRGQRVDLLATTRSVEEVAALIWTGDTANAATLFYPPLRVLPIRCKSAYGFVKDLPPIDAFQSLLPLAAVEDLAAYDLRPANVAQTGARILQLLTIIATGTRFAENVAASLQRAWRPDDPAALGLLRAALIVCADHELNVSAFTARCVASAGATPYGGVLAGLAALRGVHHGGINERVAAVWREAGSPDGVRTMLTSRIRRGETVPGFGHRLYPAGDPRAVLLLRLISEMYPASPAVELAQTLVDAVQSLLGERPTVDFGLVALSAVLRLPTDSALTLFALGRTIGWIGQMIEQYQLAHMIRPRARYVGEPPHNEL